MFTRTHHTRQILRNLHGTDPFLDYCRRHRVPFEQVRGRPLPPDGPDRWAAALAVLPREGRAEVECDLAQVGELSAPEATAFLLRVVPGLPPGDLPVGAPLSLWCLLRHPSVFRDAFLCLEAKGEGRWRTVWLPGVLDPPSAAGARALRAELRAFFAPTGELRPDYVVEIGWGDRAGCYVADVPDRPRHSPAFTVNGRVESRPSQPPLAVTFAPVGDRTVLLQSPLRGEQEEELMRRLCVAVLNVEPRTGAPAHDLTPLKEPFRPLPDSPDMESVRLRALHLRYPGSQARRRLALETLSCDGPFAVEEMLRTHVPEAAIRENLEVSYAELQFRLRVPGGVRTHIIRLWPDHSNLGPTPLGERLRSCLRRWGLCHVD